MPLDGTARSCVRCRGPLPRRNRQFCGRNCQTKVIGRRGGEIHGRKIEGTGTRCPYIRKRVNGRLDYLHRVIWEQANGRKLKDGEIVHHINGNKRDNRPENLEAIKDQGTHMREHGYFQRFGTADYDRELGF